MNVKNLLDAKSRWTDLQEENLLRRALSLTLKICWAISCSRGGLREQYCHVPALLPNSSLGISCSDTKSWVRCFPNLTRNNLSHAVFPEPMGNFHNFQVLPQQRTIFTVLRECLLVHSDLEFLHVLAQGGLVLHRIALFVSEFNRSLIFLCS